MALRCDDRKIPPRPAGTWGNLWNKPGALANLEEEIMDLPVYYKTAKDQLRQMAIEGRSAAEAYEWLYGELPTSNRE